MPSRVSTNQHFNTPAAVCDMYSLGFMGALIKTIGEKCDKKQTSASSWLLLLEVMLKIVKHQKLIRKLNLKKKKKNTSSFWHRNELKKTV